MPRSLPTTNINPLTREVTPAALVSNPPLYFPHDWSESFGVATQWSTDVVASFYAGWEETTGTTTRPLRAITATHKAADATHDFLRQYIMGLTPRNEALPTNLTWQQYGLPREVQVGLDCDCAPVESVVNSQTAAGDWGFRRLFLGQRVFVRPRDGKPLTIGSKRVLAALAEITYVDRQFLALSGLPFGLQAGMQIVPVVDCMAVESTSLQDITGRVSEAEVEAQEARGASQIPPHFNFRQDIPQATLFDGVPVLVVDHNWRASASQVIVRPRSGSRAVSLHGPSSRRGIQVSGTSIGRDVWFDALTLFDAMQGQAGRVWAVLPSIVAGPTNPATRINSTRYRIPEYGSFDDWLSMHQALAFQREDGTWSISRIAGSPAQWEVTLTDPVPTDVNRCIRWAALCRFGDDGFEESWVTPDRGDFSYTLYEATNSSSIGLL